MLDSAQFKDDITGSGSSGQAPNLYHLFYRGDLPHSPIGWTIFTHRPVKPASVQRKTALVDWRVSREKDSVAGAASTALATRVVMLAIVVACILRPWRGSLNREVWVTGCVSMCWSWAIRIENTEQYRFYLYSSRPKRITYTFVPIRLLPPSLPYLVHPVTKLLSNKSPYETKFWRQIPGSCVRLWILRSARMIWPTPKDHILMLITYLCLYGPAHMW